MVRILAHPFPCGLISCCGDPVVHSGWQSNNICPEANRQAGRMLKQRTRLVVLPPCFLLVLQSFLSGSIGISFLEYSPYIKLSSSYASGKHDLLASYEASSRGMVRLPPNSR